MDKEDYRYYVQVPRSDGREEKITYSTDSLKDAIEYRNEKWFYGSGLMPAKYFVAYREEDPDLTIETTPEGLYQARYIRPLYEVDKQGNPCITKYRVSLRRLRERTSTVTHIPAQNDPEGAFLNAVSERDYNTQRFNAIAAIYNQRLWEELLEAAALEAKDLTARMVNYSEVSEYFWRQAWDETFHGLQSR
jgi:hypothetical protein